MRAAKRSGSRRVLGPWALCVAAACLSSPLALRAQAAEPDVYDVDGLRVAQLVIPGDEVVSVRLYLLGGSRELTSATAGVERFVLRASERGTEGFPGDTLRDEEARTGSEFFSSSDADWSVIGFTGLTESFDRSFELLADRVVRPTLDSASVEITRNQMLTDARAESEDPDETVRRLAESLAFEGHPYAVDVSGTEASLAALSVTDLQTYQHERFVRSRMLLSVAGSVDRSTLEEAVRRRLGSLPLGSYTWSLPGRWGEQDGPRVQVQERTLPTNYIMGYFGGPTTTDDDYPAFQVAVAVLSGYVSSEIRSRGLSYAAGADLVDRAALGGGVFVSTVNPGQSVDIINDAIETFTQGSIRRSFLRDYAESSALEYYLSNQTTAQQADFLATSLLLTGKPRTVVSWVEALRGVAGNDVRRIFREYVKNIQYGYLGAVAAVPRDKMMKH